MNLKVTNDWKEVKGKTLLEVVLSDRGIAIVTEDNLVFIIVIGTQMQVVHELPAQALMDLEAVVEKRISIG